LSAGGVAIFREFLNRVDDIILFHTLNRSELRQIISIQIKRVQSS